MARYCMNRRSQSKQELFLPIYWLNNPKGKIYIKIRTDLWSMYVDLEIKHGNIDKAR